MEAIEYVEIREISLGIYEVLGDRRAIATLNLTPGRNFYGEQLVILGEKEYRLWNPYRSKLAASVLKGARNVPVSPGKKMLYLGVASGTTCSHISDIVGASGHIWGVDFAPRPFRDLIDNLSKYRRNISPILGDARHPEAFSALVPMVDVIYADIAQPDQSRILAKNSEMYLKPTGWVMMMVKSRSIDVTRIPEKVYHEQVRDLREHGFEILQILELKPYQDDHALVTALPPGSSP